MVGDENPSATINVNDLSGLETKENVEGNQRLPKLSVSRFWGMAA